MKACGIFAASVAVVVGSGAVAIVTFHIITAIATSALESHRQVVTGMPRNDDGNSFNAIATSAPTMIESHQQPGYQNVPQGDGNSFQHNAVPQATGDSESSLAPPVGGCAASAQVSAHVGCDGLVRTFEIHQGACQRNFTIQDLMETFYRFQFFWSKRGESRPFEGIVWRGLGNFKPSDVPPDVNNTIVPLGLAHKTDVDIDLGGWLTKKRRPLALDFGCGVGRLAIAWITAFDHIDCIDQSPFHLEVAMRMVEMKRAEVGGTGTASGITSTPDLLRTVNGKRYDFVNTVQTMQHMSRPLQQMYMEQFCDILRLGGRGWAHPGGPPKGNMIKMGCDVDLAEASKGSMMNWFDLEQVPEILRKRGCAIISIGFPKGPRRKEQNMGLIRFSFLKCTYGEFEPGEAARAACLKQYGD